MDILYLELKVGVCFFRVSPPKCNCLLPFDMCCQSVPQKVYSSVLLGVYFFVKIYVQNGKRP